MNKLSELIHAAPLTRPATCEIHGVFESRCFLGSIWTQCPTCTKEMDEKAAKAKELQEREAKQAAWKLKVNGAGIPERFTDRSLKSFVADTKEKRDALKFAEEYADDFNLVLKKGRCAVFIGQPGTGKTHLAAGIALRIMYKEHRSVHFTTVLRAIRSIKDTWNKTSTENESKAVAALIFPDLLILDEVGVQFGSETEKLILFDVLNERYEKRKPTLLISNLTMDEVSVYLGERIVDRMKEDGGQFIVFDWSSFRGA
jgi:DNA replication protein DnaC